MEWVGDGGVEGRSERGAGGGAGPMMRRRLEVVEEVEELREMGEGEGGEEGSSERLRLVRWGGRVGPTVGMFGCWRFGGPAELTCEGKPNYMEGKRSIPRSTLRSFKVALRGSIPCRINLANARHVALVDGEAICEKDSPLIL